MVKCLVCNKEYKKITALHVRTHGMELEEYDLLKESREKHTEEPVVDSTDDGDFKEIENNEIEKLAQDTFDTEIKVEYTYEDIEANYE